MTDLHFGNEKKKVETEKLYNWLTQLKGSENFPAFALSLGDSVDMGFLSEYKEYISFCNKLQNDYGINGWQKSLLWYAKRLGVEVVSLDDIYEIR